MPDNNRRKGNAMTAKKKEGRNPQWAWMDGLFRIGPTRIKAKDGSGRSFIIEHRVGKAVTSFRFGDLMKKSGMEKHYSKQCARIQRRITDEDEAVSLMDAVYAANKKRLNAMISRYRKVLVALYKDQGIAPCMSFVPVNDTDSALYIQGFVDEKLKPVAGAVSDLASYTETTYSRTKALRDKNEEAQKIAREILKLPNVNKDVQLRMGMVVKGKLEFNPSLLMMKK